MTDHDAAPSPGASSEPLMGQWLYALSEDSGLAPNGRPGKTFKPVRPLNDKEYDAVSVYLKQRFNLMM